MREYNNRTVYDRFNNPFSVDFGRPALNITHTPIDDSPCPNKRAQYTSDPLPAAISVTLGYFVSTLTTPSDYPQLLEPNYDDPDTLHIILSENPCRGSMAR